MENAAKKVRKAHVRRTPEERLAALVNKEDRAKARMKAALDKIKAEKSALESGGHHKLTSTERARVEKQFHRTLKVLAPGLSLAQIAALVEAGVQREHNLEALQIKGEQLFADHGIARRRRKGEKGEKGEGEA
jgi:Ran GTPase-activating protein (RanGAP) involved in mRNA processing and transport